MSQYTQNYVETLVQNTTERHATGVPLVTVDFKQHLENIGMDTETTIDQFIAGVSYQDKRRIFQKHGFKVNHMSLRSDKVNTYLESKEDQLDEKSLIMLVVQFSQHRQLNYVIEAK